MIFRDRLKNEYIRMDYMMGKGDPFVIEREGEVLGYIWYELKGIEMYIEMFEIVKKGKGIGDEVIDYIFNNFDIEVITGYAEKSHWDSAYRFWSRLGARMFADEEEFRSYFDGEHSYFELFKEEVKIGKYVN